MLYQRAEAGLLQNETLWTSWQFQLGGRLNCLSLNYNQNLTFIQLLLSKHHPDQRPPEFESAGVPLKPAKTTAGDQAKSQIQVSRPSRFSARNWGCKCVGWQAVVDECCTKSQTDGWQG